MYLNLERFRGIGLFDYAKIEKLKWSNIKGSCRTWSFNPLRQRNRGQNQNSRKWFKRTYCLKWAIPVITTPNIFSPISSRVSALQYHQHKLDFELLKFNSSFPMNDGNPAIWYLIFHMFKNVDQKDSNHYENWWNILFLWYEHLRLFRRK